MNQHHLTDICSHLDLGNPIKPPTRVYGGLLHTMWYLTTHKASYAIKQLPKNIDLTDKCVTKNYELSEYIASRFIQLGIPAVSAYEKSGTYLTKISDTGYLTYPWLEAKTLAKNKISERHALQISAIVAKIHLINLKIPTAMQAVFDSHTKDSILALIRKTKILHQPFSDELQKNLHTLLAISQQYQDVIPTLKQHTLICHGDLDQKNVLWDERDQPILIDWESAQKRNPTYDIIATSLDWSGITTELNNTLFSNMIRSYQNAGGIIDTSRVETSLHGILGSWLNWLIYNIERACQRTPSEDRNIGLEQVKQALPTIVNLNVMVPELVKIINL